jgi:tape measure domain-containing protein
VVDRVIAVRLKIEIDEARRNAAAAATAFRGIASAAQQAGQSSSTLAKLGGAAKAVGKIAAGAGTLAIGGMTALAVATGKTGVSYNALEQTSRAALKTVLGSASAASGQMERLREFGKTSPFPRQIWISAQQQLLAFGMSAEKIIPTFQAVQDAVAAAGGGGQQITEVVDILAKVQSTGRVTADTLNELGYRGIDAATLIGDAMGKTAAEVRDDIQSQAIGGVQFIDMLTAAMEGRFAGAAANVKATWEGAKDRIKGALRDVGSLLATPLVDPAGGGAAVDWANAVADALRALEERLKPVMDAIGDRAGPLFDALTAKLKALAEWIRTADFAKIGAQIQSMLPAIAGITAGFATMGAQSLPVIGNLVGGLKPLPVALAAAALASPELRSALFDLLTAAGPLISAVGQTAGTLSGLLGPALAVVAALLQPVIAIVQVLANVLNALPAPVQAVVVSLGAIAGLGLAGKLSGIVGAFQNFGSEMQAQKRYAAMAGQEVGTLGSAYSVAASKVSGAAMGIRGAMAGAAGFLAGPWGAAIGLGISALGLFAMSQEQAKGATEDFNIEIDRQTGALTGASIESIYRWAAGADTLTSNGAHLSDVLKDFGLTAKDLTGYLIGDAEATERVNRALASHDSAAERNSFKQFLGESKNKLDQQRAAIEGATSAGNEYGSATDGAANGANGLASAASGAAAAMTGSGYAASNAAAQIQAMNAELQTYFDQQFGLETAQDKFQSGLHGLKALFDNNSKATTKSAGTADKYNDAMKRQAKIVKDTQKQLRDLAQAQRDAEKEAAEAAKAAKQRALDDLFGKTFDTTAAVDAFRSSLAQAGTDIAQARKDRTAGATSLTGYSEGALANRDRMRQLVQQAQAVIQSEMDRGASKARVSAVTKSLTSQLSEQAKGWGLTAREVKTYTQAIAAFGGLANRDVKPNLAAVRKEYAEQRAEIKANSAEQIESARESARSASASTGAAAAVKVHTAALKGNSESAIENREHFRNQVKAAQDELAQMQINGASKEELTTRGEQLGRQLEREAKQLGFNKKDVEHYSDAIRASATVVRAYPPLKVKVLTEGALQALANFQKGVDRAMGKIVKNYKLGITTTVPGTSRFLDSSTGGHYIAASGGYIRGPGGPKGDKIPAMLSDREFVQRADATDYYGVPFMHAINERRIPRDELPGYAGGGPVNLTSKITFAGGMGRAIAGMRNSFQDTLFSALGMVGAGSVGGAGVQRWAPLVLEVLRLLHQPSWLLPKVLRRMNQESGGNPRAINLWDSNAKRGTPSIGLMQTIGPTFDAHAGPFRSRGIYDPLANIYAGLHYAIGRYPSLAYAMDKPGGYAAGGLVGDDRAWAGLSTAIGKRIDRMVLGSYERGTDRVPMTGLYQLHRGERVVPAHRAGGGDISLTVRGDGTRAADFVVDSLLKAQGTGRITIRRAG